MKNEKDYTSLLAVAREKYLAASRGGDLGTMDALFELFGEGVKPTGLELYTCDEDIIRGIGIMHRGIVFPGDVSAEDPLSKKIRAFTMLSVLAEKLNDGWRPMESGCVYYPIFGEVEGEFKYLTYGVFEWNNDRAFSMKPTHGVPVAIYFKNQGLCHHVGAHFAHLYKDLIG